MTKRALLALSLIGFVNGCEKQPTSQAAAEPSASTASSVMPANTASVASTPSAAPSAAPSSTPSAEHPMPNDASALAKGSNDFAFDLYAKVQKAPGNLAMSPASISAALAMTYGGAKGETAAQMKKSLHFTGDPETTMTAWGSVQKALTSPGRPLKIHIANRLFGEKTFSFEKPFLEHTKTAFDAPLEPTDFKTGAEAARGHINGWVEGQTEKRITNLLPSAALTADTRLVLVNAIYFLADWEHPFQKDWTRDQPFHLTAKNEKPVPTMNASGQMPLATVDGAKIVELPYKGGSTAMWVVVPNAVDGLGAIEKKLTGATFDGWKEKFTTTQVDLALPRFEVNPQDALELGKELKGMGMSQSFDSEKADFTAMANPSDPKHRLYMSHVFHKAFVKTDEKGTEAAAATAVVMAEGAGRPQKAVEVKVDRPFLFFIVDKSTSLILFMGRVNDPSSH